MRDWARRRLAPDAEVYSDGLACFAQVIEEDQAHTVLVTSGGRAVTQVRGERRVNIALSDVKRALDGRYHSFRQAKYARRYQAEAAYHFNRRFRLRGMLPRLVHAMLVCKPCPEATLRAATNFVG